MNHKNVLCFNVAIGFYIFFQINSTDEKSCKRKIQEENKLTKKIPLGAFYVLCFMFYAFGKKEPSEAPLRGETFVERGFARTRSRTKVSGGSSKQE